MTGADSQASWRQDRRLEPHQIGRQVEAELVEQHTTGAIDRPQRIGLAAVAVQRDRQLRGQPFAQRVLLHGRLELGDHLRVPAEVEHHVEAQLVGAHPQLVEPRRRGDGPLHLFELGEVGERRTAPQPEGLVEVGDGGGRVGGHHLPGPRHLVLEGPRVHLVGVEVEHVAGPLAAQPVGLIERAAQPRHVPLQRGQDRRWGVDAPQVFDQALDHDQPAFGVRQPGQHGPLPRATDGRADTRTLERRRAEDAQEEGSVGAALFTHSRPRSVCPHAPRVRRGPRVASAVRAIPLHSLVVDDRHMEQNRGRFVPLHRLVVHDHLMEQNGERPAGRHRIAPGTLMKVQLGDLTSGASLRSRGRSGRRCRRRPSSACRRRR